MVGKVRNLLTVFVFIFSAIIFSSCAAERSPVVSKPGAERERLEELKQRIKKLNERIQALKRSKEAASEAQISKGKEKIDYDKILSEEEKKYLIASGQRDTIAEKLYEKALQEFRLGNYLTAKENVELALSYSPYFEKAQRLLVEVQAALGEHPGEIETIKEFLERRFKILAEQTKIEINNHIDKAKTQINEKKYKDAIRTLDLVEEKIKMIPYDIGLGSELQLVKSMREEAKRLEEEQKVISAKKQRMAATRLAFEEERKRRKKRKEQIEKLFNEAIQNYKLQNFEKTIELCEQVLEIEPLHKDAEKLIETSKSKILEQFKEKVSKELREEKDKFEMDIKKSEVGFAEDEILRYPKKKKWKEIEKRSEDIKKIEVPLEKRSLKAEELERILERPIKIEFPPEEGTCSDTPTFGCFVKHILPQKLDNIPIDISQSAIADGLPDKEFNYVSNGTVPAGMILKQILLNFKAGGKEYDYFIRGEMVEIDEKTSLKNLVLKIYDISSILAGKLFFTPPPLKLDPSQTADLTDDEARYIYDPIGEEPPPTTGTFAEGLINLIKSSIAPGTWDANGTFIYIAKESLKSKLPTLIDKDKGAQAKIKEPVSGSLMYVKHTPEVHEQIQKFLDNLMALNSLLVSIEARIISVDDNFLEDVGIDLRGNTDKVLGIVARDGSLEDATPPLNVAPKNLTSGFNQVKGVTSVIGRTQYPGFEDFGGRIKDTGGLGIQIVNIGDLSISAVLRAVRKKERAVQIQATRVLAHNDEQVYIKVTRKFSYIQKYNPGGGGIGLEPVLVNLETGLLLLVRPTISMDRKYITLELKPMITRMEGSPREIDVNPAAATRDKPGAPVQLPITSEQRTYTTAKIPDNGSVLIAGLRDIFDTKFKEETPIVSKIPIVGALFKRKGKTKEKHNLIILITAQIVDIKEIESKKF